jgi:hypothetical protein
MDGTCSTHRREDIFTRNLSENLSGGDNLKDTGVNRRIILKWTLRK